MKNIGVQSIGNDYDTFVGKDRAASRCLCKPIADRHSDHRGTTPVTLLFSENPAADVMLPMGMKLRTFTAILLKAATVLIVMAPTGKCPQFEQCPDLRTFGIDRGDRHQTANPVQMKNVVLP